VNHRGLDLHFYMGAELDPFENAMRAVLKRHVARGHVDVRVQSTRVNGGAAGIDEAKLEGYMRAFRVAMARYRLSGTPDLNLAFQIPGMLTEAATVELPDAFGGLIVALLERALEILNEFRSREGAELASTIMEQNASVHRAAKRMGELRTAAVPAFQARLRERLTELLGSTNVDPQRLVQEAAMLADRSDIVEEVSRLEIHSRQVDDMLRTGTEIGKKLDFMLQEMNRETNTILSKTAGVGEPGLSITELALGAKSDIERMREQSLNLE